MASQAQATPVPKEMPDLYEQVDKYPWDSDDEFQGGLIAILGSSPSSSQVGELTLRARCFYYSRKFNTTVDFTTYKSFRDSIPNPSPISPTPQPQSSTFTIPSPSQKPAWTAPSAQKITSAEPMDENLPRRSYQEIVEMIQSGKPVPGIKDIPSTVLEGQGTQASAVRRKKPWETDGESATA